MKTLLSLVMTLMLLSVMPHITLGQESLSDLQAAMEAATDNSERAEIALQAAELAEKNNQQSEAIRFAAEAYRTAGDDDLKAKAAHIAGLVYLRQNDRRALTYLGFSVKSANSQFEKDRSQASALVLARYHKDLGVAYEQFGDVNKMEENLRRAAIYARKYARNPQLAVESYTVLGAAFRQLKQYDKARRAYEVAKTEAQSAGMTTKVREINRTLGTLDDLIKTERERQTSEMAVEQLRDSVVDKEEIIDTYLDSLALSQEDNKIQVEQKEYYALKAQQAEAELKLQQQRVEMAEAEQDRQVEKAEAEKNLLISIGAGGGAIALLLILSLVARSRSRKRANKLLSKEKERTDDLLLAILPEKIATELKNSPQNRVAPVRHENVSILFTDFKGFSTIAEQMDEEELIKELEYAFRGFDEIMERYGLEKIKTIGDAYMAAAGLVKEDPYHALNAIAAGMEMQEFMWKWSLEQEKRGATPWQLRVGINSGPVVAGVVGTQKFAYDIWGSSVNLASRMESAGQPGRVNVSASTHREANKYVQFGPRRTAQAKNIGDVDMYFVEEIIAKRKAAPDPETKKRRKGWFGRS